MSSAGISKLRSSTYGDLAEAAWNVTNRSTFSYKYRFVLQYAEGYGNTPGLPHKGAAFTQWLAPMTTRPGKFHSGDHHALAHELAHVYTLSNRVSETPAALAAAHLYFSELTQGGC